MGAGALWLRRLAGPFLSLGMLCLALWALHKLAREVSYHQVARFVHGLPDWRIALAVVLTALSYVAMTLYDWFGVASLGKRLPRAQVSFISFLSYAFSNTLGMALLVSGSIRYRFYIQAGLSTAEVAKVVLYCTLSFWLGLFTLTGVTLLIVPVPATLPFAELRLPIGALLTLLPVAWMAGSLWLRKPVRVWRWPVSMPTPQNALRQIIVGTVDWGLAASVLYLLMPNEVDTGFGHYLADRKSVV